MSQGGWEGGMPTGTTGNTMAPVSSQQSGSSTVEIPRQRGGSPVGTAGKKREALLARGRNTPGRLTLLMAVLAFLALASGVAGVADVGGQRPIGRAQV